MEKEYQKPEVEVISLISEEPIADDSDDYVDGEMGLESSIF